MSNHTVSDNRIFSGTKNITVNHNSLYFALLDQGNALGWMEWFACPAKVLMNYSCIHTPATFYKTRKELKEFGLIDYQEGENRYSQTKYHIVRLSKNDTLPVPLPSPVEAPLYTSLNVLLYYTLPDVLQDSLMYNSILSKLYNLIKNNLYIIKDGDVDFFIKNNKEISNTAAGASGDVKTRWAQYLDMRTAQGKSFKSQQAKELMWKRLRELAGNEYDKAIKILEQSIRNEWLKLLPLNS